MDMRADATALADGGQTALNEPKLADRSGSARAASLLRSMFRLSRSQAEVAAEIVTGRTVKEIARSRAIGEPTVRTHLHRAFAKTGTTSQSQLCMVVLSATAAQ